MKTGLTLALLLVLLGIVLRSEYVGIRTGLIAERKSIDAVWTELNAAIESRADLVPGLAEAMQTEAPDLAGAIQSVTDTGKKLQGAQGRRARIEANTMLDMALGSLLVRTERRPKLESSRKYEDLLDAMKESEYHIAVARRKYNEAVEHYNTRLALFPSNIVASLSGFDKIDAYMPASPGAQTPSKIEN